MEAVQLGTAANDTQSQCSRFRSGNALDNQLQKYSQNVERWTRITPKRSEAALTGRDETEGVDDLKPMRAEWDQQAYALEQGAVIPQGIGARARVLANDESTSYRGTP